MGEKDVHQIVTLNGISPSISLTTYTLLTTVNLSSERFSNTYVVTELEDEIPLSVTIWRASLSSPLASNVYKGKNSVLLAHGCICPYVGRGDILLAHHRAQ